MGSTSMRHRRPVPGTTADEAHTVRRTNRPLWQASIVRGRPDLPTSSDRGVRPQREDCAAQFPLGSHPINHPVVKLHAIDPPVLPFELSPKVGGVGTHRALTDARRSSLLQLPAFQRVSLFLIDAPRKFCSDNRATFVN